MTYGAYPSTAPASDPTNVMGRRIGAYLIDLLFFIAAGVIFFVGFAHNATKITGVPSNFCDVYNGAGRICIQSETNAYVVRNSQMGGVFALTFLFGLLGFLNVWVLQGITGASIGKFATGIRVVRADGQKVGFGWNLLRSLLLVVDNMFAGIVGLVTASVTHPHRRVGDMAAGTYVVGAQSVGIPIGVPASSFGPPPGAYAPPSAAPGPSPWSPPASTPAPAPAAAPAQWAPPAAAPAPAPEPEVTTETAVDNAPGWAAVPPTTQAAPAPAPASPPPPQPAQQPQWDPARRAYVIWDPSRQAWLQYYDATGQWGPISQ